jgi:hypothetical protein
MISCILKAMNQSNNNENIFPDLNDQIECLARRAPRMRDDKGHTLPPLFYPSFKSGGYFLLGLILPLIKRRPINFLTGQSFAQQIFQQRYRFVCVNN